MSRLRSAFLLAFAAGLAHPAAAQQNPHGKLPAGLDCSDCHTSKGWTPDPATVKFDHDRQTGFKLVGRHRDAACHACHLSLKFDEPTLKDAECATCHADVHRGAYTERCASCHTTVSFSDVPGLQVHARTSFPLTGAHALIACRACHVDSRAGAFAPLDPQCISCHRADYERASPVNHVTANFPTDCTRCHVALAWPAYVSFDHVSLSNGFRLLGAHARIRCVSCHAAADMTPLWPGASDQDCITCHQPDYTQAHPGNSFPQTCLSCHTMDRWQGATFAHSPSMTDCVSCHHADFVAATSPVNHTTQGIIEAACSQCHDNDAGTWERTSYVHGDCYSSTTNRAHQDARCAQCHTSGYPAATCTACHENRSSCREGD